jgi:TDG/mug DNA glycosylase family protein
VLYQVGLTPRLLRPEDYQSVLDYGIGLTDVVKTLSGRDSSIPREELSDRRGRLALLAKMQEFQPRVLAFNGKKAAKIFLDRSFVDYGPHPTSIGRTELVVLPSTSGAARGFWDETYWQELAALLRHQ